MFIANESLRRRHSVRSAMFIDRTLDVRINSVRRSGIQLDCATQNHSAPPNGAAWCVLPGSINMSPERQEKLGVSGWVKVPVEKV